MDYMVMTNYIQSSKLIKAHMYSVVATKVVIL
jgi:hypothetical protein